MLDEQGHLECEIKELRLEIKENAETMDNLCNLLERNNEKLRKLKEMNHRTPSKPQAICMVSPHNSKLEYLDEQTVIVNGVKYRRVEEPKPSTLLDIVREWCDDDNQPTCEELVSRIENVLKWTDKVLDGVDLNEKLPDEEND
jgi:DNA-binding transcriptional regulator GbsR (MarR family)